MGEVWKAEHIALNSPLAIKVIVDAGFDEANPLREELVKRFFREAQAAAALRSPHVVQIMDHGVDGVPYIAMELLEGETLEQRLEREMVLQHIQTVEIITHVARAISKAHEVGIVHRDLKPGNVFIVRNDDEEIAKVLDFGIAKITPAAGFEEGGNVATRTGSVVGTPCYMSPEQALGNKTIDHRSDLWSLAVIVFECVVGQRPFDSEALGDLIVAICARPIPVPSKMGRVPDGFDAWWAKAANRDPDGRFQSAKELAEALRMVLAPETISHRPRITQPSSPMFRVTVPPPSGRDSDEFAKTRPFNQATHAGVVSAVASSHLGRRRKPMLLIGAASFALTAGVLAAVLLGRNKPADDGSAASQAAATAPGPGESSGSAPGAGTAAEPSSTAVAHASATPDSTPRPGGAVGPAVSPSPGDPAGGKPPDAAPSGSSKANIPAGPSKGPRPPPIKQPTKPPDRLGF